MPGKRPGTKAKKPLSYRALLRISRDHEKVLAERDQLRVSVNQLQDELRQVRSQLGKDPLTALLNRRSFEQQVVEVLMQRRAGDRGYALAIIDIDDFKVEVNDRYGHPVGDKVIAAVADVLATSTRKVDVVARIGGEEYAILFANITRAYVDGLMREIAHKIGELTFHEAPQLIVRISYGIAVAEGPHEGFTQLYERADKLMYEHKRKGKRKPHVH